MSKQNAHLKEGKQYLVAHVIHRLQVGGLENGLVNLINNMPDTKYKHVIICMTEYTEFKNRLKSDSVKCYALHKKRGKDLGVYLRLWKLLRKLQPDILHTRNIGTIECVVPAFFAGVKHSVHGEHGRDMQDIDGMNSRYIILRRMLSPFIQQFIGLSQDLEQWLLKVVGIPEKKISQIYNGVDLKRFILSRKANDKKHLLFGTVGRLSSEKDQLTLVMAYIKLLQLSAESQIRSKLMIVGEGPLKKNLQKVVKEHQLDESIIFTGASNDVPNILKKMDVFVLPSLGEGISNTILEAMASGLPVIATDVGGNSELVEQNITGLLVPRNNPDAMARAMLRYVVSNELIPIHGSSGRQKVEQFFSLSDMVKRYVKVYDNLIETDK